MRSKLALTIAVLLLFITPGLLRAQRDAREDISINARAFTPSTLQVDCAGHFRLCFTLKAGDPSKPQPTDCALAQVCTETDYTTAGQEQPVPDLPPWSTDNASCSQQFATTGGYGEMSVKGTSIECDEVPDHVFNRVGYCPTSCNQDPKGPGCQNCMQGGSGAF